MQHLIAMALNNFIIKLKNGFHHHNNNEYFNQF